MQSRVSPIQCRSVLWKFVLLWILLASVGHAQPKRRTLDVVLTGGAGYYVNDTVTSLQPTANIDFFAQTSNLDLTAGVHAGFTKPFTKSFSVGLRLPVSGTSVDGHYLDASLLFFDDGSDDQAFTTGLRAAFAGRVSSLNFEYRLAGEFRRVFSGSLQAWGGIELGFFLNLLSEDIRVPTRKDTLIAALKYIATTSELLELHDAKTDADLDTVIARMWRTRDAVPETPVNEARLEFEHRVREADSNYSTPRQMGVETDQGRVLVLYGEPDRIESAISTIEPGRKYQLWSYSGRVKGLGTAIFLFRTNAGSIESYAHGEYRQVYSNIPSEPSDAVPYDLPPNMRSYILALGR